MRLLAQLRTAVLVGAVAGVFAAAGGATGHLYAGGFEPCGDDNQCNSVPDGCGVGVNCIQKDCTDVLCPNGNDDRLEKCNYCDTEN
jgi:hypothetical protein